MRKSKVSIERLKDFRKVMREFAPLQQKLRNAVIVKLRQEMSGGERLGAIGARIGVTWGELKDYVDRPKVILSDRLIDGLVAYIGEMDLGPILKKQVYDLRDARSGLIASAACPASAIELAFDVHEAYVQDKDLSSESFASAFEPYSEIVKGVLSWRLEDIQQLADSTISALIFMRLCGDLSSHYSQVQAAAEQKADGSANELDALCNQLLPRFKTYQLIAEALGVHSDTLRLARKERGGKEMTQKLIRDAQKLVNGSEKAEHDTAPSVSTTHAPVVEPRSVIHQPSVLTEQSFRLIPWIPTNEEIETMGAQIGVVCANLNLLAQMESDGDRERVRNALSGKTVELHSALRLFTAAYPGQMTALVDAERRTLASMPRTTQVQTVRKGRK